MRPEYFLGNKRNGEKFIFVNWLASYMCFQFKCLRIFSRQNIFVCECWFYVIQTEKLQINFNLDTECVCSLCNMGSASFDYELSLKAAERLFLYFMPGIKVKPKSPQGQWSKLVTGQKLDHTVSQEQRIRTLLFQEL